VRPAGSPLVVVGSRSHRGDSLDGLLAKLGAHEMRPMGSALKFCLVAEGTADFYPRLGPTSEWDTAAAQAVLEVAGGAVTTLDGQPLRYNRRDTLLNPFFLRLATRAATGHARLSGAVVDPAAAARGHAVGGVVLARQPRCPRERQPGGHRHLHRTGASLLDGTVAFSRLQTGADRRRVAAVPSAPTCSTTRGTARPGSRDSSC
jgi:hypothetical protein